MFQEFELKTGKYLIYGELYNVPVVADDGFLLEDSKGESQFYFFENADGLLNIMQHIVLH